MEPAPEYAKHIRDTERKGFAWCGAETPRTEFHFLDVDHAAQNGRGKGWLVARVLCVRAVELVLRNGVEE